MKTGNDQVGIGLSNRPDNFAGGKIIYSVSVWEQLTSDPWIKEVILGNAIDLEHLPIQDSIPAPLHLSSHDQASLDSAMEQFIDQNIVEPCSDTNQLTFYSNVFPREKSDGSARVILNLKTLNLYMDKIHFKMDTFKDVTHLVFENCYFVTVDFKHAYYSVPVNPHDRRFLRFIWHDQHYQFTCLPQGLTSAPRIFTKLLKPVLAHLRSLGIVVLCYIDDCIFVAESPDVLSQHVQYAIRLFDDLGLTVHPAKSILDPSQVIEFLGFKINSKNMTVSLTSKKQDKIRNMAIELLNSRKVTIRDLASFIGNLVATQPAVPLAPLRYKYIEIAKNKLLNANNGVYDAKVSLASKERFHIAWWADNVHKQYKSLRNLQPQLELFTDASLLGWGATLGNQKTGGEWSFLDKAHINVLELKAVLFGLRSLCGDLRQTHIIVRSDNTTTVACIERCSSTKIELLRLTDEIFTWAQSRSIALSAEHIRGVDNVDADLASRSFNPDTEWMIDPPVFQELCLIYKRPSIDLFATRINAQLPRYVSWRPDPHAYATDAFTIDWNFKFHYIFPPFSLIGRILQKLQLDQANVLLIAPLWPTQTWFSRALQLLSDRPRLLPRRCLFLPQDPSKSHHMSRRLVLAAMPLSGVLSKVEAYRRTLPLSSWNPGGRVRINNMGAICNDGCRFVSGNNVIHFAPL